MGKKLSFIISNVSLLLLTLCINGGDLYNPLSTLKLAQLASFLS